MVKSPMRVTWFWGSPELAIPELSKALGAEVQLSSFLWLSVLNKVDRHAVGQTRRGKDYKLLAGYSAAHLFELRWRVDLESGTRPIRLISAPLAKDEIALLTWHAKVPTDPLLIQRFRQNRACEQAVMRLRELVS